MKCAVSEIHLSQPVLRNSRIAGQCLDHGACRHRCLKKITTEWIYPSGWGAVGHDRTADH